MHTVYSLLSHRKNSPGLKTNRNDKSLCSALTMARKQSSSLQSIPRPKCPLQLSNHTTQFSLHILPWSTRTVHSWSITRQFMTFVSVTWASNDLRTTVWTKLSDKSCLQSPLHFVLMVLWMLTYTSSKLTWFPIHEFTFPSPPMRQLFPAERQCTSNWVLLRLQPPVSSHKIKWSRLVKFLSFSLSQVLFTLTSKLVWY